MYLQVMETLKSLRTDMINKDLIINPHIVQTHIWPGYKATA